MTPSLGRSTKKRGIVAPEPAAEATPAAEPASPPTPVAMVSEQERVLRGKLKELRDHLVKNADYVGPKFPEEARRMHYGEIEHRSIYGEASPEDAQVAARGGDRVPSPAVAAGRAELAVRL